MGYDTTAYYDDEYAHMGRAPGWDYGGDSALERAKEIATFRGSAELLKALGAEEFDGGVSGKWGQQIFCTPADHGRGQLRRRKALRKSPS
jgi:hypothetical protein